MASILIIGMGRFGQHLCRNFLEYDNEIMIIDADEAQVEDLAPLVVSSKIGDCTNEDVLKTLGVGNFDICFVCMGDNFQNSLEITSLLKEMGAKFVVCKADRAIHAKLLLKIGADEVVYPDRDIAEKVAVQYSSEHIFDYIELTDDYGVYEIPPLCSWIGKSLKDSNIPAKYGIMILGVKCPGGEKVMLPKADFVVEEGMHLMAMGRKEDVNKVINKM